MPFSPKYKITDKIVNNLTLIASAREVIEQAHLVPQWEAKLRRQAILHNTHSSTAIEGNKLTLKQVEDLADGKKIIAMDKDKQEVLNYLEAMESIPKLSKKCSIKVEDLLNIHKIVSKKTLSSNAESGAFRKQQVYVGRRIFDGTTFREIVEYMPPPTEAVPRLVEEFIEWLNLDKTWEINPVVLAAIVHYEIARIHPFIDGNGRTARLFATLILYLSGFDHRRIFALDDFYDKDRKSYYSALKTVQHGDGDLTKWIEYFADGVVYSVTEVKEAVLKLKSTRRATSKGQIALTSRQMKIVEYIASNGRATNRELRKVFDISAQAVHKELLKLVELKVIKPEGKGRSLHYILV
ncbi:MAG: Fic family protein [Candidatus Omnitrophica bacterium]|nr:Fic family protein [Candidatus Omnitrophota bacterium]